MGVLIDREKKMQISTMRSVWWAHQCRVNGLHASYNATAARAIKKYHPLA
jgi:hypothetical protein